MRISDWSSDVCSSDLPLIVGRRTLVLSAVAGVQHPTRLNQQQPHLPIRASPVLHAFRHDSDLPRAQDDRAITAKTAAYVDRSEEHTSELQSLMRISYAVFC